MESGLYVGMRKRNMNETTQPGLRAVAMTRQQGQRVMSSVSTTWMLTPFHIPVHTSIHTYTTHPRKEAKVWNVPRTPVTDKNQCVQKQRKPKPKHLSVGRAYRAEEGY